ncbi:MAG: LamG domain-containing protein [Phycisphaerales bacterium JB063]
MALLYRWTFDTDGTDAQGNYDINEVGSPSYAAGKIGNAATTDASNYFTNNLSTPAALNTPPFTWSCWVYPTATNGTDPTFIWVNCGSTGALHYELGLAPTTREFAFRHRDAADSTNITVLTTETVSLNVWTHLAVSVVVSGSTVTTKQYINGVLVKTNAHTDGWFTGSASRLQFGRQNSANRVVGGKDDFRFYNTALSDGDVGDIFDAANPPSGNRRRRIIIGAAA